jgi:hypothetical protein
VVTLDLTITRSLKALARLGSTWNALGMGYGDLSMQELINARDRTYGHIKDAKESRKGVRGVQPRWEAQSLIDGLYLELEQITSEIKRRRRR